MRVYTSLWNADNWATRGGLEKIDWKSSPFTARFHRFRARACKWNGPVSISQCASGTPGNWWTSPVYKQLTDAKMGQLNWVRSKYMIYDYCKDTKRFKGQIPPECFKQQFWGGEWWRYKCNMGLQWFCCLKFSLYLSNSQQKNNSLSAGLYFCIFFYWGNFNLC